MSTALLAPNKYWPKVNGRVPNFPNEVQGSKFSNEYWPKVLNMKNRSNEYWYRVPRNSPMRYCLGFHLFLGSGQCRAYERRERVSCITSESGLTTRTHLEGREGGETEGWRGSKEGARHGRRYMYIETEEKDEERGREGEDD